MINEPASSDQVKRWIGEKLYIGDQKTDGMVTHHVTAGRVELTDGRELDAWIVQGVGTLVPHTDKDGSTGFFTRKDFGYVTFIRPRIDQEPATWPAVPLKPEESAHGLNPLWAFIQDKSEDRK